MASSAASEAILFIGAMVVATGFIGVFSAVVTEFSSSLDIRGDLVADQMRTSIKIINDPQNVQTSPFVLYVKNTGSTPLTTETVSVLLDGTISTDLSLDVLESTDDDTWRVAEVLEITVNDLTPGSGDRRVRVVSANGVSDDLFFAVA